MRYFTDASAVAALLKFYSRPNHPKDPSGSTCKPDLVAFFESDGLSVANASWSSLETVGKIQSASSSLDDQKEQAASYAEALLEARPDRHFVDALYVDNDGVAFISANTDGDRMTKVIPWKGSLKDHKEDQRDNQGGDQLLDSLVNFIRRVYNTEFFIRRHCGEDHITREV